MTLPKLVSVHPSTKPGKKLCAVFDSGHVVHFGSKPNKDFTIYWREEGREVAKKRAAYIARHRVHEDWLDPLRPGTLSRIRPPWSS